MSTSHVDGHGDLIEQLDRLGTAIDDRTDDLDIATSVTRSLATRPPRTVHRGWLAAAAVVLAVIVGVIVQPDARRAVARWFGLDGVTVEVDPDRDGSIDAESVVDVSEVVGPGESRLVVSNGREVLVSAISGNLEEGLISKTVGATSEIDEVAVNDRPGLWIAGGTHDVSYVARDGGVVVERLAANTLLWQRDDVLYRVEGFERLDDALDFARSLDA